MTIKNRRTHIVALAKKQHEEEGVLEIDRSASVSEGGENGAYVAAWVWCDFTGTDFDKSPAPPPPRARCQGCFIQSCQDCRPGQEVRP